MDITQHTWNSGSTYKAQFNDLLMAVFGFSFEPWHNFGLWSEDYTCYSIIDNGVMLANASIYRMKMIINDKKKECLQLGAVATRPERRGEGLSRMIMETILDQFGDLPIFLWAHPGVQKFYPKYGFVQIYDQQQQIRVRRETSVNQAHRMKKLDFDDPIVWNCLKQRTCYSKIVDCINSAPVQWFNLYSDFQDCLYELPELGALLVARQEGNVLTIYHIATRGIFSFDDLLANIDFSNIHLIKFAFNPDWLNKSYEMVPYETNSPIFVNGNFLPAKQFILPWLIHT